MDPLSITASALTLIAALDHSVRCIRKLTAIRNAPAELSRLLLEVSDLHAILLLVAGMYEEEKERVERPEGSAGELKGQIRANLERHSERAALVLDDLNRLACDYSSRIEAAGGKKVAGGVAAFSWIKSGRKKALRLRQQLHEIRLNIVAALGANTSASIARVEQSLAEHRRQALDGSLGNVTQVDIDINYSGETSANPVNPPTYNTLDFRAGSADRRPVDYLTQEAINAMTRKRISDATDGKMPHASTGSQAPAGTIAAAIATALHNSCVAWCSCSCHSRGHLRSYPIFDPVFGSISIVYGGLLSAARPCNEYGCRRRPAKVLKMNYRAPSWLYTHLFQLSMVLTPLYGLRLDLKMPRTVGWDAPIWSLAMDGDVKGVQTLFTQGKASPWDVNPIGGSILHYATDHRKWDLCRLLLTNGADAEHEDDCRRNPASMAWDHVLSNSLSAEDEYTVGSLFCNAEYLESQGFSLLHKTVFGLVPRDLGTDLSYSTLSINDPDANGRTPLLWATRRDDAESVRLLLEYGADASITDDQGFQAIHEVRSVHCARALLAKGADAKGRNAWHRTPLHQLCERGANVQLLDVLISAGADVNAIDATGETPLHTAIVHDRTKQCGYQQVKRLMEAGADSSIPNLSGDSPLRFAIMFGTHEILETFLQYTTDFTDCKHVFGHSFAHSIARTADLKTLHILEGATNLFFDLEAVDNLGNTAAEYLQERSPDLTLQKAFEHFLSVVNSSPTTSSLDLARREVKPEAEPVTCQIETTRANEASLVCAA